MITRLRVQNFRCLRDVTVDLAPLTVLIGPNDSGKSSILDSIALLGRTMRYQFGEVFRGADAVEQITWQRDASLMIAWQVDGMFSGTEFTYGLSAGREGYRAEKWSHGKASVTPVGSRIANSDTIQMSFTDGRPGTLQIPDETALSRFAPDLAANGFVRFMDPIKLALEPRMMRQTTKPSPGARLVASGENLAGILDGLLAGPDRDAVLAFERDLNLMIPSLKGISTPPPEEPGQEGKTIKFTLAGSQKPPVAIRCENVSDGAMLVTAYLALAHGESSDLLLVEEPENGIHPKLLEKVVDLLRKISTGEVGNRARQVIVTTHSPILLNYVRKEEVRIVHRLPSEGAQVTPFEKVDRIDEYLREFAIGELWYLLGEKGLLEGKRPTPETPAEKRT